MHDFLLTSLVPPLLPPRRNTIDELVRSCGRPAFQVAQDARISAAALCRYRKGLRKPTALHAIRLAAVLGVSAEALMKPEGRAA